MTKVLTVVQVNARNIGQSTVTFGEFDKDGKQVPKTDGAILTFQDAKDAQQFTPGNSYEITIKPKK